MAKTTKSDTVPKGMQQKFDSIMDLVDAFCKAHLNAEYAQLIRYATAALARKRPSPLAKGQAKSWACGITHAIGMVNFLYDPANSPHISVSDLYKWFGVSSSTGQGKSKQARDLLKTSQMDPNWSLPSRMESNPMAWMISFNDMIIDARSAPLPIQVMAYQKGIIPYIPALGPNGKPEELIALMAEHTDPNDTEASEDDSEAPPIVPGSPNSLYKLEVFLFKGPIPEAFALENPVISRSIDIRGDQTLHDLHSILFKAYDREEDHLYEFQIGGNGPNDPKARCYQRDTGQLKKMRQPLAGDTVTTTIASLGLQADDAFGYWFDFGDSWWHQVSVREVVEKAPKGRYPKIVAREGASPPQYADFDE